MAESMGDDKNKLAAVLLQRTLLGEGYALKVAAMRYARLNLTLRISRVAKRSRLDAVVMPFWRML